MLKKPEFSVGKKMGIWQYLISPNPRLSQEEQRRARLLNTIILALALVIVLFSPLPQLGNFNSQITLFLGGGFVICLISYGLARMGLFRSAASLLFLMIMTGVIFYIATSTDQYIVGNLRGVTPIMAIPILCAGVIVSPRFSFVVATFGALSVSLVAFLRRRADIPDFDSVPQVVSQLSTPIFLLFILAGLSWLFESNIQALLRQLVQQNQALEETNQALGRSQHEEQRIGQEINNLSGEVAVAFSGQNEDAANQLSAVVLVTTTLEELSRTSDQIADVAQQVAESARHTLDVAQQGSISIKQSLEATVLLSDRVQGMADSMRDLLDQARQIDQIIELITEVAEETNLLALNATIEAAGAGEYGRRFAAVASEVQRLARRSQDATEQVREVINEIQEAIRSSAQMSQVGLQETSQIVGGAREAEETIEEMVTMVQRTSSLSQQISVAIQHQRTANAQVVENMHQISEVSRTVAQNSTLLLSALNRLNQSADQLRSISANGVSLSPTTLNGENSVAQILLDSDAAKSAYEL